MLSPTYPPHLPQLLFLSSLPPNSPSDVPLPLRFLPHEDHLGFQPPHVLPDAPILTSMLSSQLHPYRPLHIFSLIPLLPGIAPPPSGTPKSPVSSGLAPLVSLALYSHVPLLVATVFPYVSLRSPPFSSPHCSGQLGTKFSPWLAHVDSGYASGHSGYWGWALPNTAQPGEPLSLALPTLEEWSPALGPQH